jgi:dimeric dUTPase (all-alpha-NTP-PPase superfamily)
LLARYIFFSSKIIGGGQSSSFSFEGSQILNGLVRWGGWLLRDFTWLVPMGLAVLVWCLVKRRSPRSRLWLFAGVWMAAWLGLYIPWYFGAEYYLLPFAAGAAVLSGVLLVELLEIMREPGKTWKVTGYFTLGLTSLLLLATLANSAADASVQLAQDAANTRVMEYVAENAPLGSTVLVNIQLANEYIEQMEFLLNYDYGRTDLQFDDYQAQELSILAEQYPAVYVLVAEMQNQPKLTVRMGFIEDTLNIWNSILLPRLDSWKKAFQVGQDANLLIFDFPRLLCPLISRESYCAPGGGLVNNENFRYGWTVYTNK